MTRFAAAALSATILAAASSGAARAAEGCAPQPLVVDGVRVTATICGSPAGAGRVAVRERFEAGGAAVAHELSVELIGGAGTSRAVDDVDLAALGVKRTLHLTLAVQHNGQVTLERAIALPGATIVK